MSQSPIYDKKTHSSSIINISSFFLISVLSCNIENIHYIQYVSLPVFKLYRYVWSCDLFVCLHNIVFICHSSYSVELSLFEVMRFKC